MTSSKRLIQRSFKVDDETRGRLAGPRGPAGPDLTPRPCILFALVVLGVSAGVAVLCRRKNIQRPGAITAVLTILQLRVEAGWRAHSEQPWA